MNEIATILLVEDDDFAAVVAAEILSSEYTVRHVDNGQSALDCVMQEQPDLVLLDVDMPGMSGYEVCKTLRADPMISDLPVIFLSGMVSDEERLAGYEAGGDDYLSKPIAAEELRSKIRLVLASYSERRRLKRDLSGAFSTAMTAMSSAAEVGAVLQFLRTSFICPDYSTLCTEVLSTLASYGLEASVQISGQQGVVSLSNNGPCSPLEESVLSNMRQQGRMFEFGTRTSCCYEHIIIIMKSDARLDLERHGRMKDNLALLAEGANARIIALDSGADVARKHLALSQVTKNTRLALQEIDQRHRAQGLQINQIFQDLQKNFDRSMLSLGITHSQEEELSEMLEDSANRIRSMYNEGLEIGAHMETILEQLHSVNG